jgi:hypothetical protein
VKRAARPVVLAVTLELHIVAYHLQYVGGVDNLVNGFFRDAGHGGGLELQIYTRLLARTVRD